MLREIHRLAWDALVHHPLHMAVHSGIDLIIIGQFLEICPHPNNDGRFGGHEAHEVEELFPERFVAACDVHRRYCSVSKMIMKCQLIRLAVVITLVHPHLQDVNLEVQREQGEEERLIRCDCGVNSGLRRTEWAFERSPDESEDIASKGHDQHEETGLLLRRAKLPDSQIDHQMHPQAASKCRVLGGTNVEWCE